MKFRGAAKVAKCEMYLRASVRKFEILNWQSHRVLRYLRSGDYKLFIAILLIVAV
jgi:hypothetical protein